MIITNNPNLAVVCDAEQIIHISIDKQNLSKFSYFSGGVENPLIAKKLLIFLKVGSRSLTIEG